MLATIITLNLPFQRSRRDMWGIGNWTEVPLASGAITVFKSQGLMEKPTDFVKKDYV